MDGCWRRSEARMTSSQTSGPTVDESHELARRDSPGTKRMSTEWTDAKHSLYLKSMEASFVDQLYNSMDLAGWNSQKQVSDPKFPKHVDRDSCTPSGQFKVLRRGAWQKTNFQNRPESQRNVANESRGLLSSPWIQRFISARKPQVVPSSTVQEAAATQTRVINRRRGQKATSCASTTSLKHSPPPHRHSYHHRDMVDGNTEVSDQNFVDEDVKGGKTSTCGPKRMKTLMVNASGSDQVVPCGKHPTADVLASSSFPQLDKEFALASRV